MTEIQLGLCNPPEPIYLYVKNASLGGESYLWYRYNIEQDKTIPVQQRGLTGYISQLRLTTKEFKGKDNMKLDIVVNADELYVIRTGIETNFAKSFLLAVSQVQDFSKPLIIAVTAGEEGNVVFCRLYDAQTKTRLKRDWDANADWAGIIASIQSQLSGNSNYNLELDDAPITQPLAKHKTTAVHPQDLRVKQIRNLMNYPIDLVKEWLQFQNATAPSELTVAVVDELVRNICLAWASDKVEHPDYAESSYTKQVLGAMTNGTDELAAIKAWMNYVVGQRTVVTHSSKKPTVNSPAFDWDKPGYQEALHSDNYGDR